MAVMGIGGFFFRANDPEALSAWYARHLGVGTGAYGSWETRAGTSLFVPFAEGGDDFAGDRAWRLNLRVDDRDAVCASLRAAGVEVTTRDEWDSPDYGKFARFYDPEGNPIELWEPAASE